MTLRARIAIALAVVAGMTAAFVAGATYYTTEQRLRDEVDRSLVGYVAQVRDPDQVLAACKAADPDDAAVRGPGTRVFNGLSGAGVVVQCVDPSGTARRVVGDVVLPVSATDTALATSNGSSSIRTVNVKGTPYRVVTVSVTPGVALQVARDYGETQRVLEGLRNWLALVVVSASALGAIAGWLIARRATRPLVRLTDAAEEVASTGRLDVEVPAAGNDEPGRLARAFATMLAALGQSREQQQQLVQDAGHELRTPLTSLRTNVETLQRHESLPPETRTAILGDLQSETRELGALVDELVQLATDTYSDEPEQTVPLHELTSRIVERARRRTGRQIVLSASPTTVIGQPRVLARAVSNLIDNAAKFSPPAAPIEVTVANGSVAVRDHGPGVDPADQARVFERFYRAPSARSQPGSGLGLAIVDQAARTHGGTVSVANHPGGGAVFTIAVPTVDTVPSAPAAAGQPPTAPPAAPPTAPPSTPPTAPPSGPSTAPPTSPPEAPPTAPPPPPPGG